MNWQKPQIVQRERPLARHMAGDPQDRLGYGLKTSMLRDRISEAHLAVSSRTMAASSSGEELLGSAPDCTIFALAVGSATAWRTAWLSGCTISAGDQPASRRKRTSRTNQFVVRIHIHPHSQIPAPGKSWPREAPDGVSQPRCPAPSSGQPEHGPAQRAHRQKHPPPDRRAGRSEVVQNRGYAVVGDVRQFHTGGQFQLHQGQVGDAARAGGRADGLVFLLYGRGNS